MSDSTPEQDGSPRDERTSLVRAAIWGAIAIALVIGIVFFFRYSRQMSSLL